jgi:monoamine oxidase
MAVPLGVLKKKVI